MNKLLLKSAMINNEIQKINVFQNELTQIVSGSNLQNENVIDLDDSSHNAQSEDDTHYITNQVHSHQGHLSELQNISFAATDMVEPGAIVEINDRHLVVSIAEGNFKFDGKDFVAISTNSPLYKCIEGKKAGDTCSYNNKAFTIKNIY